MVIDLLKLAKTFPKIRVQLIGVLRSIIDVPNAYEGIIKDTERDQFVSLEVFAVRVKDFDGKQVNLSQFGISSPGNIHEVVGTSIPVLVNKDSFLNYKDYPFVQIVGKIYSGSQYAVVQYEKNSLGGWSIVGLPVEMASETEFVDGSPLRKAFKRSTLSGCVEHTMSDEELRNLGLLVENNVAERYIGNIMTYNTQHVNNDILIENRTTVAPPLEGIDDFKKILHDAMTRRLDFIETAVSSFRRSADFYFQKLLVNVANSQELRPIFEQTVMTLYQPSENEMSDGSGKTIASYITSNFKLFKQECIDKEQYDALGTETGNVLSACFSSKTKRAAFYSVFIAIILDYDTDKFYNLAYTTACISSNLIEILNENPYLLKFYGLTVDQCRTIAGLIGIEEDKTWVSLALIDSSFSDSDGSTFILTTQCDFSHYKDKTFSQYILDMNFKYFNYNGYKPVIFSESVTEADRAFKQYIDCGFGVYSPTDKSYVARTITAGKELKIYEIMRAFGNHTTGIAEDVIDMYIKQFEEENNIILEPEQVQACHTLLSSHAAGLTGCAGSGKTTTLRAIIHILQKVQSKPIILGASTGKAAQRMREVLGMPARTIHSIFHVGADYSSGLEDKLSGVFIFDECSMVTVPLMYVILTHVDADSSVYFVGDVQQLPPIGACSGLPFRDSLLSIPVQILGVSKRTREGSILTQNACTIIEHSEPNDFQELKSCRDNLLVKAKGDSVYDCVDAITRYLIGKPEPDDEYVLDDHNVYPETHLQIKVDNADDIQVIAPTHKAVNELNSRLQLILNPNVDMNHRWFVGRDDNQRMFQSGDRVMHIKENLYKVAHYDMIDEHTFVADGQLGIFNGDVGELVGLISAKSANINIDTLLEQYKDDSNSFRRDTVVRNSQRACFLVVKYYDYLNDKNFYVLYHCSTHGGGILVGGDLNYLALSFATTVHKSQGSQYKVVIFAIDNAYGGMASNFLTRNMIYTGLTRACEFCILLGDVADPNAYSKCAVSQARLKSATRYVNTTYSLLRGAS